MSKDRKLSGQEVNGNFLIELDDGAVVELDQNALHDVIEKGMKQSGYSRGKKVRSIRHLHTYWKDYNGLHFIQCACRFTENCVSCGGGRGSKRDEMKELIAQFRQTSDVIDTNIFNSAKNINLRTVIGYHKDDMTYHFLDDYDEDKGRSGEDTLFL